MSDKAAGAYSDPVLKREPASPESGGISPFDASSRGGPFCSGVSMVVSPPPTSNMVVPTHNGLLQQQQQGSGSESDSGVDAPLDFSMKSRVKKRELETPQRLENTGAPKRRALNIEANSDNSNSCSPVARYRVKTEHPEGFPSQSHSQSPPMAEDGKNGTAEDAMRAARLGEPPTALPGALPGAVGAAMPGLGMLPNAFAASLPLYMDPRRLQQAQVQATNGNGSSGSNNKSTSRPFKAYPKEALSLPLGYYGIPGMMPFPSLDSVTAQAMGQAMGSEELFNQYRMYVLKCQQEQARNSAKSGGAQGQPPPGQPPLPQLPTQQNQPSTQQPSPVANTANNNSSQASPSAKSTTSETSSTVRSTSSSPTLSTTCTTPTSPGGADPATGTSGGGSAGDSKSRTPSRKPGQQMPDERKDESYWERRRKNNEAAKRSRDSRRAKEDEIAIRAAFLEQENLKLRVEVAALKNETAKLRCMLYNS